MEFYFDDAEKQQELKRVLDEWVGTPFRHRAAVKKLGCDCIHFIGAVLDEVGVFKFDLKKIPDYPPDWHLHNTREMLLQGIQDRVPVEKVDLKDKRTGDILLGHFGQAASHSAIYFDGYIYHALNDIGVIKEQLENSKLKNNFRFALRILKG